MQGIVLDTVFKAGQRPEQGVEYENCAFRGCSLAGAELDGCVFSECRFEGCDLSMASLGGVSLREVHFEECKMVGLDLTRCNRMGFSISLSGCIADDALFFGLKMAKARIAGTRLRGADFSDCDLTGAVIADCDLLGAAFSNTVLTGADLRGSTDFTIDPGDNRVRRMKISLSQADGVLAPLGIEADASL